MQVLDDEARAAIDRGKHSPVSEVREGARGYALGEVDPVVDEFVEPTVSGFGLEPGGFGS